MAKNVGWIGKPTRLDLLFPLINLGICYFGNRKGPNARRPASLFLPHFLSLSEGGTGNNEGADFSNRSVGRIPSTAGGIQVESTRVLRVRCLVVNLPPLRPLHSLEFPARRVDRMERSQLVSQSVLSPDRSLPGFYLSEIGTTEHREWALLFPAWSMVLVLLTYWAYFSLALFATPAFSDISTITGMSTHPSLLPFSFNRPTRLQGPSARSSHI